MIGSETADEKKLLEMTRPESFKIEKGYKGPNISLPIKKIHIDQMMDAFKSNKVSVLF